MTKKEKQLLIWRILLVVLIVCNMVMIFLFSSQNGIKSAAVSQKVTISVVGMVSKDNTEKNTTKVDDAETVTNPPKETATEAPEQTPPEETAPEGTAPEETAPEGTAPEETAPDEKPNKKDPLEELSKEQLALVKKMHTPIRKLAHMLEFGSLAALAFLFLLTWAGRVLWRYAASLGFSLVYAATDELHQLFRDGRGARLSDVFIDFTGAFIACTLLLAVVILIRRKKRLVTANGNQPSKNENSNPIIDIKSLFQKIRIKRKKSVTESEKTTEEKTLQNK